MSVGYNYTVSSCNEDKLTKEINSNNLIINALNHISYSNPNLSVFFSSALSVGEKTALDVVVSNHVNTGYVDASNVDFDNLKAQDFIVNPNSLSLSPGHYWFINGNGTNVWNGQNNKLAFWNGVSWDYLDVPDGNRIINLSNRNSLFFNSSSSGSQSSMVFGNNYQDIKSASEKSTTSTSFVSVTGFPQNTTTLPSGDYMVLWSCEITNGTASTTTTFKITVGGVKITGRTGNGQGSADIGSSNLINNWNSFSGSRIMGSISGIQSVDVQYFTASLGTAFIRNINIVFWRVV